MLTVDDLKAWEAQYGRIPEGAFVAFRSDWYKKPNLDNPDENGVPHYPGWDKAAIQWLVEERNIGAIGHEPGGHRSRLRHHQGGRLSLSR